MPNTSLTSKWKELCDRVISYDDVDTSQFNALVERIQIQAMSDGFLLLTIENHFLKNWFEKQFGSQLQRALTDIYNIPFTVTIEIDESASEENIQQIQTSSNKDFSEEKTHLSDSLSESNQNNISVPPISNKDIEPNEVITEKTFLKQNDVKESLDRNKSLNSYTFENFVVGESNRLALSMAIKVAEEPGSSFLNPLFIYGKSGLGKTHLMLAIQNYIDETQPHLHTIYVDSEELISSYTDAVTRHEREKSSFKNFKTFYEASDVLLIDDIQFLQGKTQTLDIVFQIFNKLIQEGKQIVLSADRAPKNIDIEERYSSRFVQGGTIDIQPPEVETKLGIINNFIEDFKRTENNPNINIPEDVRMYIVENSGSNIRELKGAVTILIYHMMHFSKTGTVNIEEASSLLNNHFSGAFSNNLTIDDIQKEVESYFKLKHAELVGSSRASSVVLPRQIAMYLCRQLLDLPFNDIGKKFNKDYTTVMHSVNKIEKELLTERDLQEKVEILRKSIKEL